MSRFNRIARLAAVTALLLFDSSRPAQTQVVDLRSDLCSPIVVGNDDLLKTTKIPIADEAFLHGDYRLAFRAYYQYFFCFNGDTEFISPAAEDSGAARLLRVAVASAYDRKYGKAQGLAERAYQTDQRFGEGLLIAGELQWILGQNRAAVSTLSAATEVEGYAEPPDHAPSSSRYILSSAFLAKTLKKRVKTVEHRAQ